jgi:SAM-dependent methyltransferase
VLAPRRAALLSDLRGVVLDVGAGTGANLEHFHNASRVIALEPDPGMRKRLAPKLPTARCEVEVLGAPAEALPLRDQTVDAVVFTCVLCSVEDVDQALAEARRTLKPHGRLVVLEHVRGDGRLARWQDVVTPVWSCLAGGCHPNRDIEPAVLRAGLRSSAPSASIPSRAWCPPGRCSKPLRVQPRLSSDRGVPLPLDEQATQDLARRSLRDLVDELDGADFLVRRHAVGDELTHLLGRE